MTQPARLMINGYYGFGNVGDEAFPSSISKRLTQRGVANTMTIVSYRPELSRERFDDVVSFYEPSEIYERLKSIDVVLTGGGGLFQDYVKVRSEGLFRFPVSGPLGYHYVPLLAKFSGMPVMYFAQGVGPIDSIETAGPLRMISGAIDAFTVRDQGSFDLLQEIAGDSERFSLSGDPAIFFGDDLPAQSKGHVIGVNLRPWQQDGIAERMIEAVSSALGSDARPVCVPMQWAEGDDDQHALQPVSVHFGVEVPARMSPEQVHARIGQCVAFVGMRLHSLIFAASAGTIPVALSYDRKVRAFMTDIGLPELCFNIDVDPNTLAEAITSVRANIEEYRARLGEGVARYRQRADVSFDRLIELVETRSSFRSTSRFRSFSGALAPIDFGESSGLLSDEAASAVRELVRNHRLWRSSSEPARIRAALRGRPLQPSAASVVVMGRVDRSDPRILGLLDAAAKHELTVYSVQDADSERATLLHRGKKRVGAPKHFLASTLFSFPQRAFVLTDASMASAASNVDSDTLIYLPRGSAATATARLLESVSDFVLYPSKAQLSEAKLVHPIEDAEGWKKRWTARLLPLFGSDYAAILCPEQDSDWLQALVGDRADVRTYTRAELPQLNTRAGYVNLSLVPVEWGVDPIGFYSDALSDGTVRYLYSRDRSKRSRLIMDQGALEVFFDHQYPTILTERLELVRQMVAAKRKGFGNQRDISAAFGEMFTDAPGFGTLLLGLWNTRTTSQKLDQEVLRREVKALSEENRRLRVELASAKASRQQPSPSYAEPETSFLDKTFELARGSARRARAEAKRAKSRASQVLDSIGIQREPAAPKPAKAPSKPGPRRHYNTAMLEPAMSQELEHQVRELLAENKPTILFPPTTDWSYFPELAPIT